MTATALPVRRVEQCMGTVFSIDVRAPGVEAAALDQALAWLHWVDQTFSTYRADSAIGRLQDGSLALDECPREVRQVLQRCAELNAETNGYFDCRYAGRLDPSGYVKGWAIERVSDLLHAAGSANHSINGGGDVQCLGSPEPDRPWQIGITDPRQPRKLIASVPGHHLAVATSGTAERGCHILDPHSGAAPDALLSVTIIGTQLADVDAYATAAFAMGAGAQGWLRATGLHALLVAGDGSLITT